MSVVNIDHVAITAADLGASIAFYERVLGGRIEEAHDLGGERSIVRLRVGGALINIHRTGHGHPLVARSPTPGSVDICFRWGNSIADAAKWLGSLGVEVIEGPALRTSSDGIVGHSIYFRDPDGNLLELLSTVAA